MRARCCFRVVLHREHWQLAVSQSFYTLIVEIDMRHTECWCARDARFGASNREPVVLGSNRHLVGVDLPHRVVPAMVTERQLIRLGAVG